MRLGHVLALPILCALSSCAELEKGLQDDSHAAALGRNVKAALASPQVLGQLLPEHLSVLRAFDEGLLICQPLLEYVAQRLPPPNS